MSGIIILLIVNLLAGLIDDQLLKHDHASPIPGLVFLTLLIANVVLLIRIAKSDFRNRYGKAKTPGRALRGLGYLWIFGLCMFFLAGDRRNGPWWATALGLAWSSFLIWITFRTARKMDHAAGLRSEADTTSLMKAAMKRLIPAQACMVVVLIVLSFAFVRGLISPRGLGFACLLLFAAFFGLMVWIRKRLARQFRT